MTFDEMPVDGNYSVFVPMLQELIAGAEIAKELLPGVCATMRSLEKVHHYSKSIFCVSDREHIIGLVACLMLNEDGVEALLDGSLSMADPDRKFLCGEGAPVTGIYLWAVVMPGGGRAFGNLFEWLRREEYKHAPVYMKPTTKDGMASTIRCGAVPFKTKDNIWIYRRHVD